MPKNFQGLTREYIFIVIYFAISVLFWVLTIYSLKLNTSACVDSFTGPEGATGRIGCLLMGSSTSQIMYYLAIFVIPLFGGIGAVIFALAARVQRLEQQIQGMSTKTDV